MANKESIEDFIEDISDLSQYVNTNKSEDLADNLQNLAKLLYQYGQNEKSYKKSNKKPRNLTDHVLVTDDFGTDEIWSQIKHHSHKVLSTADQRSKYRTNERERMQKILNELQNDVEVENDEDLDQLLENVMMDEPNDEAIDESDIDLNNIANDEQVQLNTNNNSFDASSFS